MRTEKELMIATRQYAAESRLRSWLEVTVTLFALSGAVALACLAAWPLALLSSLVAGLLVVRMFVIYHDYLHGAILGQSKLADVLMNAFGLLVLSPPRFWKHSHDAHHKTNSKDLHDSPGTFQLMSVKDYEQADWKTRLGYRVQRHPLTLAAGYVTVFLWGMCLQPFFTNPRRNWQGALAVVLKAGLITALALTSLQALLFGLLLPMTVAGALGAYLFYAQHNYPGMSRRDGQQWSHAAAALESSSFMQMSPVMHWFTANIGYHHIHHLNAKIPFYRLPAAMAGLKELQSPGTTSLHPAEVIACLRLKLWDPQDNRLITFREARRLAADGRCDGSAA